MTTKQNIVIAEVAADDQRLTPLVENLFAYYKSIYDPHPDSMVFDRTDRQTKYFLALNGEQVAGMGAYLSLSPDTAEIKKVFVAPAFRGRHLGVKIVNYLVGVAINEQKKTVVLEVGERQTSAVKLYEHLGFQRREKYDEAVWGGGVFYTKEITKTPAQP